MKKQLLVASVALFFIASPASASQSQKNNENRNDDNRGQVVASEHREDKKEKSETPIIQENVTITIDVSPSPSSAPSSTPTPKVEDKDEKDKKDVKGAKTTEECDSESEWKNHGEYVSCVAKKHLGGKEVSEAARSEIGKKSDDHGNDGDDDILPTITPSVSPTITPPLTSPATELHFPLTSWEDLKRLFAQLFRRFNFNRNHNES